MPFLIILLQLLDISGMTGGTLHYFSISGALVSGEEEKG